MKAFWSRHSKIVLLPLFSLISVLGTALGQQQQPDLELNTALMQSTFKVTGPPHPPAVGLSVGTAFVLGKRMASDPSRGYYVLVTAAHVFDSIVGDTITVSFRKKLPDGSYSVLLTPIAIRNGGQNLYAKHASADVAAIYITPPAGVEFPLLGEDLLANDKTYSDLGIHPGNTLTALGFPFGAAANDWQFPILRSGKIASYPLTPVALVRTFLFDFHVYGGNSGGPVYLVEPRATFATSKQIPLGGSIQFIAGLVTEQLYSLEAGNPRLELGVIVPSQFIQETMNMLPDTSASTPTVPQTKK